MPATAVRPGSTGPAGGRPGALHVVHLGSPTLRTADGHDRDERRASWLGLFFDLAFAGAVGQLAGAFQDHPGLPALARFVLLFTPIWWLWVQFTLYAHRHETEDTAHQISTLAAILLCVALGASAPRALAGHPAGFIIAFACLRGLQLLLYARARRHLPATRPLYGCYLICFSASGALWLVSLTVGGSGRYAFWGAALLTDAAGSLAMLTPRRRLPLNSAHLADRFQIFVLIVLGESMARLISAAALRSWSLPLVAGIAAASAGLHTAILAADGASTIAAGPRAALYGGVSVFLLASVILPSTQMTPPARAARVATAFAAGIGVTRGGRHHDRRRAARVASGYARADRGDPPAFGGVPLRSLPARRLNLATRRPS
jgi:Bacterial low temperature requirement A protein (LtrA)